MYTQLMPPERLLLDNGSNVDNFRVVGEEFFGYFVNLCGLQPHERVLDVGSGVGRLAVPLTGYLVPPGGYDGFDIRSSAIAWCQQTITPAFSNFRFQLADIYNTHFNARGRERAEEYRFPYPDASFDFAFAASVFTHLLPGPASRYFSEIHRTLKPGGRCLLTFFLMNSETAGYMRGPRSTLTFTKEGAEYYVLNKSVPEMAVAYDEPFIKDLFVRSGLTIDRTIYGGWSGREGQGSYQDMVTARKA